MAEVSLVLLLSLLYGGKINPEIGISSGHKWSYDGGTGPAHWPQAYPKCNGARQSPIDIPTVSAVYDKNLKPFVFINYQDSSTDNITNTLTNHGHTASLHITDDWHIRGGSLDGRYKAVLADFHWGKSGVKGSEHSVDGKKHDMELHIVHFAEKYGTLAEAVKHSDGLAIIAVFVDVGTKENPIFDEIVTSLSKIRHQGQTTAVSSFRFLEFLPTDTSTYYQYEGSLSNPPCSENVVWFIMKNTLSISEPQINSFFELRQSHQQQNDVHPTNSLEMNFRPLQTRNHRVVKCSKLEMSRHSKDYLKTEFVHERRLSFYPENMQTMEISNKRSKRATPFRFSLGKGRRIGKMSFRFPQNRPTSQFSAASQTPLTHNKSPHKPNPPDKVAVSNGSVKKTISPAVHTVGNEKNNQNEPNALSVGRFLGLRKSKKLKMNKDIRPIQNIKQAKPLFFPTSRHGNNAKSTFLNELHTKQTHNQISGTKMNQNPNLQTTTHIEPPAGNLPNAWSPAAPTTNNNPGVNQPSANALDPASPHSAAKFGATPGQPVHGTQNYNVPVDNLNFAIPINHWMKTDLNRHSTPLNIKPAVPAGGAPVVSVNNWVDPVQKTQNVSPTNNWINPINTHPVMSVPNRSTASTTSAIPTTTTTTTTIAPLVAIPQRPPRPVIWKQPNVNYKPPGSWIDPVQSASNSLNASTLNNPSPGIPQTQSTSHNSTQTNQALPSSFRTYPATPPTVNQNSQVVNNHLPLASQYGFSTTNQNQIYNARNNPSTIAPFRADILNNIPGYNSPAQSSQSNNQALMSSGWSDPVTSLGNQNSKPTIKQLPTTSLNSGHEIPPSSQSSNKNQPLNGMFNNLQPIAVNQNSQPIRPQDILQRGAKLPAAVSSHIDPNAGSLISTQHQSSTRSNKFVPLSQQFDPMSQRPNHPNTHTLNDILNGGSGPLTPHDPQSQIPIASVQSNSFVHETNINPPSSIQATPVSQQPNEALVENNINSGLASQTISKSSNPNKANPVSNIQQHEKQRQVINTVKAQSTPQLPADTLVSVSKSTKTKPNSNMRPRLIRPQNVFSAFRNKGNRQFAMQKNPGISFVDKQNPTQVVQEALVTSSSGSSPAYDQAVTQDTTPAELQNIVTVTPMVEPQSISSSSNNLPNVGTQAQHKSPQLSTSNQVINAQINNRDPYQSVTATTPVTDATPNVKQPDALEWFINEVNTGSFKTNYQHLWKVLTAAILKQKKQTALNGPMNKSTMREIAELDTKLSDIGNNLKSSLTTKPPMQTTPIPIDLVAQQQNSIPDITIHSLPKENGTVIEPAYSAYVEQGVKQQQLNKPLGVSLLNSHFVRSDPLPEHTLNSGPSFQGIDRGLSGSVSLSNPLNGTANPNYVQDAVAMNVKPTSTHIERAKVSKPSTQSQGQSITDPMFQSPVQQQHQTTWNQNAIIDGQNGGHLGSAPHGTGTSRGGNINPNNFNMPEPRLANWNQNYVMKPNPETTTEVVTTQIPTTLYHRLQYQDITPKSTQAPYNIRQSVFSSRKNMASSGGRAVFPATFSGRSHFSARTHAFKTNTVRNTQSFEHPHTAPSSQTSWIPRTEMPQTPNLAHQDPRREMPQTPNLAHQDPRREMPQTPNLAPQDPRREMPQTPNLAPQDPRNQMSFLDRKLGVTLKPEITTTANSRAQQSQHSTGQSAHQSNTNFHSIPQEPHANNRQHFSNSLPRNMMRNNIPSPNSNGVQPTMQRSPNTSGFQSTPRTSHNTHVNTANHNVMPPHGNNVQSIPHGQPRTEVPQHPDLAHTQGHPNSNVKISNVFSTVGRNQHLWQHFNRNNVQTEPTTLPPFSHFQQPPQTHNQPAMQHQPAPSASQQYPQQTHQIHGQYQPQPVYQQPPSTTALPPSPFEFQYKREKPSRRQSLSIAGYGPMLMIG